jgi:hypothetical protein
MESLRGWRHLNAAAQQASAREVYEALQLTQLRYKAPSGKLYEALQLTQLRYKAPPGKLYEAIAVNATAV